MHAWKKKTSMQISMCVRVYAEPSLIVLLLFFLFTLWIVVHLLKHIRYFARFAHTLKFNCFVLILLHFFLCNCQSQRAASKQQNAQSKYCYCRWCGELFISLGFPLVWVSVIRASGYFFYYISFHLIQANANDAVASTNFFFSSLECLPIHVWMSPSAHSITLFIIIICSFTSIRRTLTITFYRLNLQSHVDRIHRGWWLNWMLWLMIVRFVCSNSRLNWTFEKIRFCRNRKERLLSKMHTHQFNTDISISLRDLSLLECISPQQNIF